MDYETKLRDFLEAHTQLYPNLREGWKYNSFYQIILDYGRVMPAKPLPKSIKRGLPKSCYFNCQKVLEKHKDLTYVEGYALPSSNIVPLIHAWLLDDKGEAIDPTWETPGLAYLGIPLSTEWVFSIIARRQQQGRTNYLAIFECNYLEEYSLLKQGLPANAYVKN